MRLSRRQISTELENDMSKIDMLSYAENYYCKKHTITRDNTVQIDDIDTAVQYYKQYAKAMYRRRDYTLEIHSFIELVTYEGWGDHGCYTYKDSMVHGFFKEYFEKEYFCISHFCPSNLIEGVDLIKNLNRYDNVVFVVTPDLSRMLEKLGYNFITETSQIFNNEMETKQVYLSNCN